MIELKSYTTKELCKALGVKQTSFKSHKEEYLKDYDYFETKIGRNKTYTFTNLKESKSTFIKICEQISGEEVKFPKEATAEKILKVLFNKDCTILDYEELGYEIPGSLERHAVGRYIKLFRRYKILTPIKPKEERFIYNLETGELYSKSIDPNKYTYYVVSRDDELREELEQDEYFEMIKFIEDQKNEYLSEFMVVLESGGLSREVEIEAIEAYKKDAKRFAYRDCMKIHGGVPKKTVSKVPTKDAYEVFSSYFNLDKAA